MVFGVEDAIAGRIPGRQARIDEIEYDKEDQAIKEQGESSKQTSSKAIQSDFSSNNNIGHHRKTITRQLCRSGVREGAKPIDQSIHTSSRGAL